MPNKSPQFTESTLPTYLTALKQRDLDTLDLFYNEDLTFTIGHNSFNRTAVMSLLNTTKDVMQSSFVVHSVATIANEVKVEITERILFLRDSDFLFFLAAKQGETVELKTINRYLLSNGKISAIHRLILSMNKV